MNDTGHKQLQNILMVTGGLDAGGKERQLVNLCKYLSDTNNYKVYIGVLNAGGRREQETASYTEDVVQIPRLFSGDLITPIIRLNQTVKNNDIQLIHSWGSGIWDLVCLVVAKLCRIPFLHGGVRSAPDTLRLSHHFSRWAAKHADLIVANSKAGLKAFRLSNEPTAKVIYNGLDFSRFDGINEDVIPYSLVMVSNFRSEKDHQTLLLAMTEVISSFPNTHLYLIGQDSGTIDKVKAKILQMGLTEQVTIITDSINPEDYIARSQIGILSTFREGHSNVLLEYMALTKPVIATDAGGNNELVQHDLTGFLVPLKSAGSLSERVIELLSYPDRCKEMGRAGQERARKEFSISRMGSAYEIVYQSLIDRPGR